MIEGAQEVMSIGINKFFAGSGYVTESRLAAGPTIRTAGRCLMRLLSTGPLREGDAGNSNEHTRQYGTHGQQARENMEI